MSTIELHLRVNGGQRQLDVKSEETLLEVLHDRMGMADVRYGCGEGVCGTCTVLLDGDPVSACLLLAVQARGTRTSQSSFTVNSPNEKSSSIARTLRPISR